jgi:hypothetical protein
MCCNLDRVGNKYELKNNQLQPIKQTTSEQVAIFFQKIEDVERNLEVYCEFFHLFESPLKSMVSLAFYRSMDQMHCAMHDFEHRLHGLCLFGDIARWAASKHFFIYHNEEIDQLKSLSKTLHVASHLLATLNFFGRQFGQIGEIVQRGSPLLSMLGHAVMLIDFIKVKGNKNANRNWFNDRSIISICGVVEELKSLKLNFSFIHKLSSLATIIKGIMISKVLSTPVYNKKNNCLVVN